MSRSVEILVHYSNGFLGVTEPTTKEELAELLEAVDDISGTDVNVGKIVDIQTGSSTISLPAIATDYTIRVRE